MNSGFVCCTSLEAYELFDEREWADLLRRKGVDPTRPIRYSANFVGCCVYYDDTFLGEGI